MFQAYFIYRKKEKEFKSIFQAYSQKISIH